MQGFGEINTWFRHKNMHINKMFIINNSLEIYPNNEHKNMVKSQPISRVLSCMIINLGLLSPKTSSSLPYSVP